MSDFAQHGLICTLQRLTDSHEGEIESALTALTRTRPIALILPCHGDDLAQPALAHILDELCAADFVSEIVFSANEIDAEGFGRAARMCERLPQRTRLIWNDGPRLAALWRREFIFGHGKGRNIWSALGLLIAEGNVAVIATQDCDVTSFRRGALARLCYAAAEPRIGYDFAKMYYSRVAGRIYGRVSRLFLAPFLQALIRVGGHHPLLGFLSSFRYPLAGECALTPELARAVAPGAGWDFEIGLLCGIFRLTRAQQICQVDGGGGYDHKHQPLVGVEGEGLLPMTKAIARTLLREMEQEGLRIEPGFLKTLGAAYRREGEEALRRSRHLALINGLCFEEDSERQMVEAFAAGLGGIAPATDGTANTLPAWDHLLADRPELIRDFTAAVAADNEEFISAPRCAL